MFEEPASHDSAPSNGAPRKPRILYLGGAHDAQVDFQRRLGDEFEIVPLNSSLRALALMGRGDYAGIYVDADRFAEASDVGRLLQNDRILQGMPDGVVLLDSENTIIWGNGRLREWTKKDTVVGQNFYEVFGGPEILGPEFCPFKAARSERHASASVFRCSDNRYYRLHAAPILDSSEPAQHLIVTIHDVTDEKVQEQKLAAIHQAGAELGDLVPEDVADLDYAERVKLLKENILYCMKDVLHLDVIEIRMLDHQTGELKPLMAVGMAPEAAARRLHASEEGNGVTGYVAATGKSYLCGNAVDDPLFLEGCRGARSSLTVPLLLHDTVIGTLNVESPEGDAFTDSDLQFLEIFARSVALALNTLELLAAEKAAMGAAAIEAIHAAVALPVDDILNQAVNVLERARDANLETEIKVRLEEILRNARDIKKVIQKVGQKMAPAQAYPTAVAVEARPLLEGRRILVIDADEHVRALAHEILDRYQCSVETAHDGAEARLMVRNLGPDQQYDVIISDLRLPDMTAYDLLLKLRELIHYVPLVLMSGFGWDKDHTLVKCRREGVKLVIYKPFIVDQLLSAIENTVEERQQMMAQAGSGE